MKKIIRYFKVWKKTRISAQQAAELSLYPKQPQKRLSQIRRELFYLCRNSKRGSGSIEKTIVDYFNMGCDRAGEDIHKYVFMSELNYARDAKRPKHAAVLGDKWVTSQILHLSGVRVSYPILRMTPFTSAAEALEKLRSSEHSRFFAKLPNSTQGKGAFVFEIRGGGIEMGGKTISESKLLELLADHIVEPYIEQHDALNALYPHAITSLRIVSVSEAGEVKIILHSVDCGAFGNRTSNLHQGGLLAWIHPNGEVDETAVALIKGRGRYKFHPDTGVQFKGFKIPYWEEVLDLVKRAHRAFPYIHSVGWDVAVAKDGPLIIEGNSRWATQTFQYTNGAGREYMKNFFLI